jgi:hypothetical protein
MPPGHPALLAHIEGVSRQTLMPLHKNGASPGKRDKWSFDELVIALDPPKPKENRRERREGPPLRGEP